MDETLTVVETADYSLKLLAAGDLAASIAQTDNFVKRTCFHETAHAVIGLFHGRVPWDVEIFPDGSGVCRFRDPETELDQPMDRTDAETAENVRVLLELGGDPIPDEEYIRFQTDKILRAHWSLIETMAESLYSRLARDKDGAPLGGRMTGGELRTIWELSLERKVGA